MIDAIIFIYGYAFGIVARDFSGDLVQTRTVNHPGCVTLTSELAEALIKKSFS